MRFLEITISVSVESIGRRISEAFIINFVSRPHCVRFTSAFAISGWVKYATAILNVFGSLLMVDNISDNTAFADVLSFGFRKNTFIFHLCNASSEFLFKAAQRLALPASGWNETTPF
jgi:hypothetical protein